MHLANAKDRASDWTSPGVQAGVELPNLSLQPPENQPEYLQQGSKTPAGRHLPLCHLSGKAGETKTAAKGPGRPASMSKVTVLKVDTSCAKCKRKVLQAVTGLHGTYTYEPASSPFGHARTMDPGNAKIVLVLTGAQVLTRSRWTRRRAR